MTNDDLPELIEASKTLARLGHDDPDLRAARRHARRAIALALGDPDAIADRLHATATEQARHGAEKARAAIKVYRPDHATPATRRAATALRNAIRAALARYDRKRDSRT